MDDLDKLRDLLLHDEQKQLRKLNEKLEELSSSTTEPDVIIERITPLLASIIKNSSQKDEKLLLDSLSPVVFKLIDQNFAQSQEKITKQLAPLITDAIREQIKSQKDEVVDALYPVLGNMISKYVSKTFEEMLNAINNQITNGLSFSVLSRKIRAKIKGVTETELLLSENAISSIRSVFLIHKETGIVLSHAEHENNPINEPEMIASMMTAIRSFVNDWVEKNEAHHELGTIEYGGSKIIIEASGYSYLAVIVDGSVSSKTNEKIRKVLEQIVTKHWSLIKNFNGDMSIIPRKELQNKLSTLIDKEENQKKSKKLHPLIFIIPILFFSYLAWIGYNNYVDNTISQKANNLLYKTSKLTIYRLNTSVDDKILTLKGELPSIELKQLAQTKIQNIKNLKEIKNEIVVIKPQKDYSFLNDKIMYLTTAINLKESISIDYTLNNKAELTVKGTVWSLNDKKYVLKQLKNLKEILSISDEITIIPPILDTVIYFDSNSAQIHSGEEHKLIKLINKLTKVDKDLKLIIIASSDDFGSAETNKKITMKRAENITKYLHEKGHVALDIEVKQKDEITKNEKINIETKHDRNVVFVLQ